MSVRWLIGARKLLDFQCFLGDIENGVFSKTQAGLGRIAFGMAMTLTSNPEFYGAQPSGNPPAPLGRWLLFGAFLFGAAATVLVDSCPS